MAIAFKGNCDRLFYVSSQNVVLCLVTGIVEKVMKINGINNTTWTPAWNHGKTQVIRVPMELADQVLKYAKWLDTHEKPSDAKTGDFVVLQAIDKYIKWRRCHHHPNQHSRKLNTSTRTWDELRKFRTMVETNLL
jgi:hypothetical protein